MVNWCSAQISDILMRECSFDGRLKNMRDPINTAVINVFYICYYDWCFHYYPCTVLLYVWYINLYCHSRKKISPR